MKSTMNLMHNYRLIFLLKFYNFQGNNKNKKFLCILIINLLN